MATNQSFVAVGLLTRVAVNAVEILFAAGFVGAAAVILVSFMDDVKEVFSKH